MVIELRTSEVEGRREEKGNQDNIMIPNTVGPRSIMNQIKFLGNSNSLYFIDGFYAIQCNTIHFSSIQYNTIQYNTIQYNTIQYNTIQYNTT